MFFRFSPFSVPAAAGALITSLQRKRMGLGLPPPCCLQA